MIHSTILKVILAAGLVTARPVWSLGALYSMTNDPAGNSIIINAINFDGSLTYAGSVPTGGTGAHGNPGTPPAADALFSQNPMKVVGNHLFLVNPGSNSVSMFFINPADPLDLKMIGKPVSSGGEFPVSVDISPKTGDVCVLNGGKVNGLKCFTVDPNYGMKPHDSFWSFGLNQTTPASGPANAVSHVLFSSDGTKLRASVKGNPGPPAVSGFVATWDVAKDGTLSHSFTKTIPTSGDGLLPFGMTNVVGSKDAVMVTDPALGLTVYDFSKPTVSYEPLTIDGQMATCWVEYSTATESYWLSDLVSNNVYEASVDPKTLKPTLLSTFSLGGENDPTDIAIGTVLGKQYLYALAPSISSIDTFSLQKGKSKLSHVYDFGAVAKDLKFEGVNLAGAALYVI